MAAAIRHGARSQDDPHPWQPSQMQHLAAAALASARSGSQPGASAPSMDLDAAEVLPLSQEMLDKPLACGGSTVLGAWEEEAALAALQSSRATSQHSAQQQAADAAQRAAEAIRAQHEAEVQAVLDMFTAEDFASPMMHGPSGSDADGGGSGEPAEHADTSGDVAGALGVLATPSLSILRQPACLVARFICDALSWMRCVMHAGESGGAPARFRGAGSSSDTTRDTIEDGAEDSVSAATTAAPTASPGEASPSTAAASPPQRCSRPREPLSMAPLPLSPISVTPTQLIGSPAALPPAPVAGGRAPERSPGSHGRRMSPLTSPPEALPGERRPLPLVLSPTQPRRASPAATTAPAVLRSLPGTPQDESTQSPEQTAADGGAAMAQPAAKRRLRLELPSYAPGGLIAPSDADEPQLHSSRDAQAAGAHAATEAPRTAANAHSRSVRHPPLGRAVRFHPQSDAVDGGRAATPSPLAVHTESAAAREMHAAAPAAASPAAPDSPLSIHGIGRADADLPHGSPPPSSFRLQQSAPVTAATATAMAPPRHRPLPEAAAKEAHPGAMREPVRGHTPAPFAVPPTANAAVRPSPGAHASVGQQQQKGEADAQPVHSMFRLWGVGASSQHAAPAADTAAVRLRPPTGPLPGWRGAVAARGRPGRGRRVRLQVPEQKVGRRRAAAAAAPAAAEPLQWPCRPPPLPDFLLVAPGRPPFAPSHPPRWVSSGGLLLSALLPFLGPCLRIVKYTKAV